MRVAVICPVRNGVDLIETTVMSLVRQSAVLDGRASLSLHVQDAASTDGTVDRVHHELSRHEVGPNVTVTVTSQSDTGLYDGLAKGFSALGDSADWYAYLNAGDLWSPTCLDTLADVAEQTDAKWVCGVHAYFNARGTLVHTRLPFRYTRDLLRAGAYGRGLPTVQQESTFWHRDLHSTVNWQDLASYRLAGDAYLWWSFAERAEPSVIQALLGGFTYHGGHLGSTKDEYRAEIGRFAGPLTPVTRLRIAAELPLWEQPARLKARMNPNLYLHSTTTGGWTGQRGEISAG